MNQSPWCYKHATNHIIMEGKRKMMTLENFVHFIYFPIFNIFIFIYLFPPLKMMTLENLTSFGNGYHIKFVTMNGCFFKQYIGQRRRGQLAP